MLCFYISALAYLLQVRPQQGQAIQPVRSATSETRAPMASIRPMAVSTPVTASAAPVSQQQQQAAVAMVTSQSQTPTATVHPTTQDSDVTAPLQVVTSARPTQAVQAVSPQGKLGLIGLFGLRYVLFDYILNIKRRFLSVFWKYIMCCQ